MLKSCQINLPKVKPALPNPKLCPIMQNRSPDVRSIIQNVFSERATVKQFWHTCPATACNIVPRTRPMRVDFTKCLHLIWIIFHPFALSLTARHDDEPKRNTLSGRRRRGDALSWACDGSDMPLLDWDTFGTNIANYLSLLKTWLHCSILMKVESFCNFEEIVLNSNYQH